MDVYRAPVGLPCPPPDDPSVFSGPSPLFDHTNALTPGLARFCRYDRIGTGSSRAVLHPPPIGESQPSLMVVAPMSTSLEDVASPTMATRFSAAAGVAPMASSPSVKPWLVLVDSSPTTWPGGSPENAVGMAPHGWAMTNIAHELVCPGATCVAELGTSLALELYGSGPSTDAVDGGRYGSISSMARAVARATHQWDSSNTSAPLVIAIPLGWLAYYTTSLDEAPAASMWTALHDARCRGALVIAAAGNETGGPDNRDGAMLPAGWTTLAMSPGDCVDVVGGIASDYAHLEGEPLIQAAGGVDADGHDLDNSRPDARPTLVAYGDHAVVDLGTSYTPAQTGTSVSATVIASAAATVWAHRPSMSASDVVHILRNGGSASAPVTPSLCPDPDPYACGLSTHVELCGAVAEVCATGSCLSSWPVMCSSSVPPFAVSSSDMAAWESSDHTMVSWPNTSMPPTDPSLCDGRRLYHEGGGIAAEPCPDIEHYGLSAIPFTTPQPHDHLCPTCVFQPGLHLAAVETRRLWSDFDSVTLTVEYTYGTPASLTTSNPPAKKKASFTLPPALQPASGDSYKFVTITAVSSTETYEGYLAIVP